jgi:putative membrane protein
MNTQTELAKERNRIAADRTLLAWIRSSMTLIGFGFGLDQILKAFYSNLATVASSNHLTQTLNLAFMGLGAYVVLLAIVDYQDELRRLQQPVYRYQPRLTIGVVVAPALIFLAIGAFVVIWISDTV